VKGVRLLVFGGWYGSRNLGDDAILIGLREIMSEALPEAELVALSTDPAHTKRTCGVSSVRLQSPRSFTGHEARGRYVEAFRGADACILSGGTPIYDYDHISRCLHLGAPYILGKRVVFFGVGAKPITSVRGLHLLRFLLKKARLVSARDLPSKLILGDLTTARVRLTGDSALFMRPSGDPTNHLEKAGVDAAKEVAAICPRVLSTSHTLHYHDENTLEAINGIRHSVAAVADHLLEEGFEVLFTPMHCVPPDDDRREIRRIRGMMKGRGSKILPGELSPQEAMSLLGRMSLVVGLRLHSLIFAASQGVPITSIGYDSKIRGFMDLAGVSEYLCPASPRPGDLLERVDTALRDRDELKETLLESTGEMRDRIREEAIRVASLLSG